MSNPIPAQVKIEKYEDTGFTQRWNVIERATGRRLGEFWKHPQTKTIRTFLAAEFSNCNNDPFGIKMEELPHTTDRQGDAIQDIYYYTVGDLVD